MKHKFLVPISLALLSSAGALSAASQIHSGAYAGIGLGAAVLSGKNQVTISSTAVNPNLISQANYSVSSTSFAASLFTGYGMKLSTMWLGGELSYQFDSLKDQQNPVAGTSTQNLQSSSTGAFGAALHVGFTPNEKTIAYAILGIEARKFNVKFSENNFAASISKKYTSVAFAPGVGVRFALTQNIGIRTEYKYAFHSSKTITVSAKDGAYTDTTAVKHQPRVHSFTIGLVYSF